jgi:Flp pilus assembly pilin Flp
MAGIPKVKITFDADFEDLKKGITGAGSEVEGFGSRLGDFGKKAAAAFAVAGAAAAAYAGKLLIDGVKSAIEDEKSQKALAVTLGNVTGATNDQIKATEDYILKTSLANGVTDDELRPSLDRLVRSTGNVEEAQKLQNLALDVAAGTGKSLQAVSEALAKAHDGNFAALKKLGVPLDENIIKTKDFDAAQAALAKTFEGQASTQADTFAGKMDRLKIAFDEGKETVGSYVLDALTPMVSGLVNNVIPAISNVANTIGTNLKPVFEDITKFVKEQLIPAFKNIWDFLVNVLIPSIIKTVTPIINGLKSAFSSIADAIERNNDKLEPFFNLLKDIALFIIKTVAPAIGTVLGAALTAVGKILGGLIDGFAAVLGVIEGVVNAIRTLVSLVTSNPVVKGISGLISSAFGGGKASGGSVAGGTTYLVGEKGPELFTPSSNGSIVPNSALGGGGGATINLTVNGAIDPEGTARTIVDVLNRSFSRGTLGALNFQS